MLPQMNEYHNYIHDAQNSSAIQLYSKSTGKFTALPDRPHKPVVNKVKCNSITLTLPSWDSSTSAEYDDICHVNVSYRAYTAESNCHTDWIKKKATIHKKDSVTISDLNPNTKYSFKVSAQYPYGRSEYSDVSEPMATLLGRPGKPQIIGQGKNSINIEWTPPESNGHLVNNYSVRYRQYYHKEADWRDVTTTNTSATLNDLLAGSIYICRIVANGKFTDYEFEESEVTVFDSNTKVGKILTISCLGQCYKPGMIYDHCNNELHQKDSSWLTSLFKKPTQMEVCTYITSLDIINNNNLYSNCGIDDNLKLSILTGLVKPRGASAALIKHLSNKDSIALHFKCITKVEKMSSPHNPDEGTHVVGEVRHGVDAIFIVDHFGQGNNNVDIKAKIKNAIDCKSFQEVKDIGGTLFIDNNFEPPHKVETIEDIFFLYDKLSREKLLNSVPIEVKLFPSKILLNRIDPMITEQIAVMLQHLNSVLVKCTQMMHKVKTESITGEICTQIACIQQLTQGATESLKREICTSLPQIREGSEDVLKLKAITEKHLRSSISDEINRWIARIQNDVDTIMKYYSLIDEAHVWYKSSRDNIKSLAKDHVGVKYVICMEFVHVLEGDTAMIDIGSTSVDRISESISSTSSQLDNAEELVMGNIQKFNQLKDINQCNKNVIFAATVNTIDLLPQGNTNMLVYTYNTEKLTTFTPCKPNKPVCTMPDGSYEGHVQCDVRKSADMVKNCHIAFHVETDPIWICLICPYTHTIPVKCLQPNTSYVFKVAAEYEYCLSEYSDESEPITTPDYVRHITRPGKPQVCRIQPNAITLRWEESHTSSDDDTVQHYVMYYRSKDSNGAYWNILETTDATAMITVDNLFDDLPYTFKVVAVVGKCGISEESKESDAITIRDNIPSKPGKPTVLASSCGSITITWDAPQHNAHLVTQYVVKCCANQSDSIELMTKSIPFEISIKNVATCTQSALAHANILHINVVVKVLAHSRYGISKESDSSDAIAFLDRCSPPGKPIPVIMPPGNVIKLTWSKPKINFRFVEQYCVKYRISSQQSWITKFTETEIPEYVTNALEIGQFYIFKVMACDITGARVAVSTSEESDPISIDDSQVSGAISSQIKTSNSCDSFAPGKPKVTDIDADDLEIKIEWKIPNAKAVCNCLKEYKILVCCTESFEDYSFYCSVPAKNIKAKVKELQKGQRYRLKVVAVYEDKYVESEESNIVKVSEELSCPGKPLATNITESSITLKWTPPEINLDLVKHYQVSCTIQDYVQKQIHEIPQATFNQLSSGLGYTFKVAVTGIFDSLEQKESEESDPVFTKPGVPSKPVQCGISHNEVSICWQPPVSAGNMTRYCVYYNSLSDFGKVCTSNNKPQVLIPYLQPNTSYTFSVVSMCGDVCSDNSEVSQPITTEPYQCSEPGKPEALNVNYDEVTLSWTKPEENITFVQSYTVIYQKEGIHEVASEEASIKETTATIHNLVPNTKYSFKVTAKCKSGACVNSCSTIIETKKKVCSPPGQPTPIKVTHDCISLKWSAPERNSDLVKSYAVYCGEQKKASHQICTDGIENKFEDLKQDTQYFFQVEADCGEHRSEMSIWSNGIRTKKACSKPGKPNKTGVTYNSISLEWGRPNNKSNLVKHYVIQFGENTNKVSTNNKATIPNLTPNTPYTFQVIAHCGDDVDIVSEVSDPITTDKAICSAPCDPVVTDVAEYSAVVQWSAPVKYPELVKSYIVKHQNINTDLTSLDSTQNMKKWINELEPDTTYKVKVCVQLQDYDDETCTTAEVSMTTLPDVCSEPGKPRCEEVTYNRIRLTWDEPSKHKELIQKYSVTSTQHDTPPIEQETPGMRPEINLIDLNSNAVYTFKVVAVCSKKDLRSSASAESNPIKTKEEICSAPGMPTASNTTRNSITLHWTRPVECAHLVHHYDIHYTDECDDEPWEIKTNVMQEVSEIDELESSTKYVFKVQAVCKNNTVSEFSQHSEKISTRKIKLVEYLNIRSKVDAKKEELLCLLLNQLLEAKQIINDYNIAKYTFGTQPPPQSSIEERVLLLIGATGSGKSTMINAIVNYIFGVEWKDEYRLKIIHDEVNQSQAHSQTQWITSYTFYWQEGFPFPYTLTIVDTPGFGDTKGKEQDQILVKRIKHFFKLKADDGGIDIVHGVGLLTPFSTLRLSQAQKYIYNSMLSIFGDDVASNILILATFYDGGDEAPIKKSIEETKIPLQRINGFLFFNNGKLFKKSTKQDTDWLTNFQELFKNLINTEAVSIQLSREVLEERDKLKAIVSGLRSQIDLGLRLLTHEHITKKKIRGEPATNCPKCCITCHYPCHVWPLKWCKVLKSTDGICSICYCPRSDHQHNKYCYVYCEVQGNTTEEQLDPLTIKKGMEHIYLKAVRRIHDASKCSQRLREIALLKPEHERRPEDTEYIISLIQTEEEEAKEGYERRKEYLQQIQQDIEAFYAVNNFTPTLREGVDDDGFYEAFKEWKYSQNSGQALEETINL